MTKRPPRWTEYQPVEDLVPAERNAKTHDLDLLAASVEQFGFIDPVVVDERTGRLIGGHGRKEYLETREASGEGAPDGIVANGDGWQVLVLRGVASKDDAHAEAMGIALNRVGERGGWEAGTLVDIVDTFEDPDLLEAVGFTVEELDDLIAAFPVGLPAFFVSAYTDPGDAVFDPFVGSGSTILAAHETGRTGYGMELSPAYCDIILDRFERHTETTPTKQR